MILPRIEDGALGRSVQLYRLRFWLRGRVVLDK
jgi:hypothetical protein